jgi:hypothetical protein
MLVVVPRRLVNLINEPSRTSESRELGHQPEIR